MKNVMVDLETMGTGLNSAIVAIGAVEFSVEDGLDRSFYQTVDLQSCLGVGLQVDGPTVMWWLKQSDAARHALQLNAVPVMEALRRFADWCGPHPQDVLVWGNGAAFDNALLRNAYNRCFMTAPWRYGNDRCYRTLKALRPEIKAVADAGVSHHALDDAVYQANHAIEILKALG